MRRSHFLAASAGILLLSALLRLWDIGIKPAHFDEGINGWFADEMRRTGFYRYDPSNYHGPLHFYAVFVSQELLGRSLLALRLPAILAGILGVAALLRLAPRFFGRPVALLAAAAMAVSPAFVFYSRYSIHETWLVLFNLLFFFGALGLWREGSKSALALFIWGLAGMILTKETYLLQAGTLFIAFACLAIWSRLVPLPPWPPPAPRRWDARFLASHGTLALGSILFFYSGTFHDWPALHGLWKTFAEWFSTGMKSGGHEKTAFDIAGPLNWYWVWLLLRNEWFALLGLAACAWAPFPGRPVPRLTAIYAFGLLLAYSIIPYKTPWCVLAVCWPLLLVAPAMLLRFSGRLPRAAALALLIAALLADTARSLRLNFRDFANPAEPYVYVQTFPEIERLTAPVLHLAHHNPMSYAIRGDILVASYYPLPWIFGDFHSMYYFGKDNWPERLEGDFVVVEEARKEEALAKMLPGYRAVSFRLREGMEPCVVFFRESVFPRAEQK